MNRLVRSLRHPICWRALTLMLVRSLVATALLLAAGAASAQVCVVTSTAPVFGNYSPSAPNNTATGTVAVSCTLNLAGQSVAYQVHLGLSAQAQSTQRRLSAGSTSLNYNVYCDASYSQVWADGLGSTCTRSGSFSGLLGTLSTTFTVYGQIPRGQFGAAGTYNDSISVSVLY